jgi:hypothetical protein
MTANMIELTQIMTVFARPSTLSELRIEECLLRGALG